MQKYLNLNLELNQKKKKKPNKNKLPKWKIGIEKEIETMRGEMWILCEIKGIKFQKQKKPGYKKV